MRVYMTPDYRAGNPYQQLLAGALAGRGVEVVFPVGYKRGLPLLRGMRAAGSGFDVLHLHWLSPYLSRRGALGTFLYGLRLLIDLLLCRSFARCRIVWTVHNLTSHEAGSVRVELLVRRALGRIASVVLVHTESARYRVASAYRLRLDRIRVTAHGHYRGWYGPPVPRPEARRRLSLEAEVRVYLFLGFLRPYKGLEDLLEAWRGVDVTSARLVIVGEPLNPDYLAGLRRRAAKLGGVRIQAGRVPDAEVTSWLAAADVFVLPMGETLTSGSLLLAKSYGLPVIAPASPLVLEVLGQSGGVFYNPSAPDGLSGALKACACEVMPAAGAGGAEWDAVAGVTAAAYTH